MPYQYLQFFLEDDDELARIREEYKSGRMLTGEIKAICIEQLTRYVTEFQERRAKVTDEVLDHFMARRPLHWRANPHAHPAEVVVPVAEGSKPGKSADGSSTADGQAEGEGGETKLNKTQLKKLAKAKMIAEKKEAKAREKEAKAAAAAAATSDGKAETSTSKTEASAVEAQPPS